MVEPSPNDEDAELGNGISKRLMGGRGTPLPTMEEDGNMEGACSSGFSRTRDTAEGGDSAAALVVLEEVLEEKDTATAPAQGLFRLARGLITRRSLVVWCRRDRASPKEGSISVLVTTNLPKTTGAPRILAIFAATATTARGVHEQLKIVRCLSVNTVLAKRFQHNGNRQCNDKNRDNYDDS